MHSAGRFTQDAGGYAFTLEDNSEQFEREENLHGIFILIGS
jgi:hypothetical protein